MTKRVRIIGLSGTNGSGKDTVGELLAREHHYLFVSVTELLRDEARSRGLIVNREHLRAISAEWRRAHGLGVLVDKAYEYYQAQSSPYNGLVLSSLRNPGEVERTHELGGIVAWIDADPKVRYERVRGGGRGRDAEDDKTFEEFLAEEAAEMHASGDVATLDMAAVRAQADVTLTNNSTDLSILKAEISEKLID